MYYQIGFVEMPTYHSLMSLSEPIFVIMEKELLPPRISRLKLAVINPIGIGRKWPKTGEM